MKGRVRWSHVTIAVALITTMAIAVPAIGGPSLKKLVKKEVSKQIAKATGPAGPPGPAGTNGANGADGTARAYAYVVNQALVPARTKNVIGLERLSAGTYCLRLPPTIDASEVVPSVTPDFSASPHGALFAFFASSPGCSGSNALKVVTGRFEVPSSTAQGTQTQISFLDEAFTVVVP
jgi:hypothetical protein